MPYLPHGATAAQRDAFAQRLTQHLAPTEARSGLMALREAFARAGGFPDAHAAEQMIKHDNVWRNPLAGIGLAPMPARRAYRFLGIHPAKLFEWAKEAWRTQRPLLAAEPFDGRSARILLAGLWGHTSWDQALRFERTQPRERTWRPELLRADTIEALREAGMGMGRGNFRGLHMALGTTPEGQWVGVGMQQAMVHMLLTDEDRQRRYGVAQAWIAHRINCGDGAFVVDASANGDVTQACQAAARDVGRRVVVYDLTSPSPEMPWIGSLGAATLAHVVYALLTANRPDAGRDQILSWVALVAVRCVASWRSGHHATPHSIVQALADPRTNAWWWAQDVGLSQPPTHDAVVAAYEGLPQDWDARLAPLTTLLASQIGSSELSPQISLEHQVAVFRLPFVLARPHEEDSQHRVVLANALFRALLGGEVGMPLLEDVDMIREKGPLERCPLFYVSVDVPQVCLERGHSVVLAQARSAGCSMLRVGPASMLAGGTDDIRAMTGNTNTKISHEGDRGVVVYGDDRQEFLVDYTA